MLSKMGFNLALRFVRSRRKGALTRFISFASTCGIAIGVFAAIVGFSAMNGFEYELENRVLSVIPSAQLSSRDLYFKDSNSIQNILSHQDGVISSAPVVEMRSIVTANRAFTPILINGIYPKQELQVIDIQQFINVDLRCLTLSSINDPSLRCSLEDIKNQYKQALTSKEPEHKMLQEISEHAQSLASERSLPGSASLTEEEQVSVAVKDIDDEQDRNLVKQVIEKKRQLFPRIILGSGIAKRLKVEVGDTIDVITFEAKANNSQESNQDDFQYEHTRDLSSAVNALRTPQRIKVMVVGIIHIGGQLDSALALMDFEVAKDISKLDGANTIHIKTNDLIRTKDIVRDATVGKIKESAYLVTWMNSQGKLYHDIQMVRQIMFIAMFLVLAVACFNIVSNLMMLVGEKRREIAILLTMGMKPRQIVQVFSLMGIISGTYGLIIGLVLGVLVSAIIAPITSSFKNVFGFDLLNEDVYFINFIPCRLELMDVLLVVFVAVIMSLVAALYPAYRASQVKPAMELSQ